MPDIPANTSTTAVLDPGPAIGTFSGRLAFNGDLDGVGDNSIITFATATGGFYFLDIGESGNNATGTYSIFSTSLPATDHLLSDAADTYTGAAGERILGGKGIDAITLGSA